MIDDIGTKGVIRDDINNLVIHKILFRVVIKYIYVRPCLTSKVCFYPIELWKTSNRKFK